MGQLLVRNLDDETIKRLKKRARREGRSLQAQVKAILEQEAKWDPDTALKMTLAISKRFKGRKFGDSAKLIREDRNR
jgi:antitoxin FitA